MCGSVRAWVPVGEDVIHQLESVRLGTHATGWSEMQIEFTLADSAACWRGVRPGGEGWVRGMAFTRVLGQRAPPAGWGTNMVAGTTWPPQAWQALGL